MELKFILESLLFSAQKPLSSRELRELLAEAAAHAEGDEAVKAFKKVREDDLSAALEQLAREHEAAGRSYRLARISGAWPLVRQPEYAPWAQAAVGPPI